MPDVDDNRNQRDQLMEGLRTYAVAFSELGRVFASSLSLHNVDANALLAVITAEERGEPLSQSRLSQRIGLTPGATSILINRLEERGHLTRSRVHSDRRVVTLHSSQAVREIATEFFAPLAERLDGLAKHYPAEVSVQFKDLLDDICEAMNHYIVERGSTISVE